MTQLKASQSQAGLIGHTGFVGGALRRQSAFDHAFNSQTIGSIAGQTFATLVCAAAPGSMVEANTAPERDRARIQALIDQLADVHAERFVLISSIAVLADFAGGAVEETQDFQTELAYGRHRRELEAFVEDHFADSLIVRLPALFACGLKKNFLFDLMNPVPSMLTPDRFAALRGAVDGALAEALDGLYTLDPAIGMMRLDRTALNTGTMRARLEDAVTRHGFDSVRFHNPATTFQYYGIDHLWSDITTALDAGLSHIHLAPEPLQAGAIHLRLTGRAMPDTGAQLHHEDMRTRHADLWGRSGPYIADAADVLDRIEAFYRSQMAMA